MTCDCPRSGKIKKSVMSSSHYTSSLESDSLFESSKRAGGNTQESDTNEDRSGPPTNGTDDAIFSSCIKYACALIGVTC